MGSSKSKGRKKAEVVALEHVEADFILSVDSGPNLNLGQPRRSHVSISIECLIGGAGGEKKEMEFAKGGEGAMGDDDNNLRRKSESSLLDLTKSVETLSRCIETINMHKAAHREKLEEEEKKKKNKIEETEQETPSEDSESSTVADEDTLKIGDFGSSPRKLLLVQQQVTTPAMLKLNQGSTTASCKSFGSNKSKNKRNDISIANGEGDYVQPNLANVRSRTKDVPRSKPSQLGPFLVSFKEEIKQRSPPPIDSVTMIYKKSNERPSIASIQVQQMDAVELDHPEVVSQLIQPKAPRTAPRQDVVVKKLVKPPGLGLRTAMKMDEENVHGRQAGNLVVKKGGTRQSDDSAPNSLNPQIGGRSRYQDNFERSRRHRSNALEADQPTRKLKIKGLRSFVEKRRPGPPLWARQFPCRSKFHPDSYLYDFEGPTAPKRPVEAMSACRKKCGRCRACGVFSDDVCPTCGNCPIDCKCPKGTEEEQPGPEYFLSQIIGPSWSQKHKIQVNNADDPPQPIFPRSRNLNNLTSNNNPLKINNNNNSDSPVKSLEGDPAAPPVIATGYNTYTPAQPTLLGPQGSPYYPSYGYPYFGPPVGPPPPVMPMPMMYPPGMIPMAPPPPFYAPYPTAGGPPGVPPPYAPGPVY